MTKIFFEWVQILSEKNITYFIKVLDNHWIQDEFIIFISDTRVLSVGAIIGLMVSSCVFGILIGAAAIYCVKLRRATLPFNHKVFDNPMETIENFESTFEDSADKE